MSISNYYQVVRCRQVILDRDTMIGYLLAEKIKAKVGDIITLRGRDFQIIGIFRKGTFTDNDAWISLQSAQSLIGLGE